ncbi:Fe-S oxidoreductase [Epulopiscium sp. SCG-B10WGA-EpuloA2]|nr:Fe-S oxidoreductase [Epulopiscium sp. SCG-B10WGA-EpuloA2]
MRKKICTVLNDSIASELEIDVGDYLISINGEEIVDVFDYRYLISNEEIDLLIETKDGQEYLLEIDKDEDEDLGLVFETELMDKVKSCQNKCKFCFIDQLPTNMRETVYFKDDDWRLSFLYGNYITLTNMKDNDYIRLAKHKLSPLNISIHATNGKIRENILSNKKAGNILEQIRKIISMGIQINAQIVLCKGLNDGEILDKTIEELSEFIPNILSLSIVPVGITKFRNNLANLECFDKESSQMVIETVNKWQKFYLNKMDTRFVFAADEFYVVGELNLPEYEEYEGFPVIDNGVGMLSKFRYELIEQLQKKSNNNIKRKYICPTGVIAYKFMLENVRIIQEKFCNVEIKVWRIENEYFGKTVTVTGLLTGSDIIRALKGKKLDDKTVLIAENMLKMDEDIFLDNKTISDLEKELSCKVQIMPNNGALWIDALHN